MSAAGPARVKCCLCGGTTGNRPCGCCQGVTPITPVSIWNPPGLTAINYRVGTYGQFRETMLASISGQPALSGLTTRADDDLTIGILDSWAAVGDVLSFYQERIANEGFLRTATERLSLLQLAREIGYELGPGVAASAYLAFTIDDSGSVANTLIDVETKIQSVPLQGKTPPELPQIFETRQAIVAYPEFNNLAPLATTVQKIDESNIDALPSIVLAGTNTRLQTGDHLLIALVQDSMVVPIALKTVSGVVADQAAKRTTVDLALDPDRLDYTSTQPLPPNRMTLAPVAIEGVTDLAQVDVSYVAQLMQSSPSYSQLKAMLTKNNWQPGDFAKAVNSSAPQFRLLAARTPGTAKVFALRSKAGIFGNNAQPWSTLPTGTNGLRGTNNPYPISWEYAAINTNSQGALNDQGEAIYLDNRYPSITSGNWVVLKSAKHTFACIATSVFEKSLADFAMSAKATGLSLDRWISLTPQRGPPGTFLTFNGYGFPPGTISLSLYDGTSLTNTSANQEGLFSVSASLPATLQKGEPLAEGPVRINALDNRGNILASCVFTVANSPVIFVIPSSGPLGTATIYGFGFPQSAKVDLTQQGFVSVSATSTTNVQGSFGPTSITLALRTPPPIDATGPVTIYADVNGTVVASCVFLVCPSQQQLPFTVRETTVFADSEELQLADVPVDSPLSGLSIAFGSFLEGLQEGQQVVVTGELTGQPGIFDSEVVSIQLVSPFAPNPWGIPATSIQLAGSGLLNSYDPQTVAINANVALATHGETKNEVVGSGDPTQPYLEFALKQKPLTYVRPIPPASTPTGSESTLQVWVDGIRWKEVPSLYGVTPSSRSYIVRRDDDGTINVLFGNARPAVGIENITAKYRVGTGLEGMIRAGQLSILASKPLGVQSVTNPLPADGAGDPEDREHARKNAPTTVLTLDRIVSLADVQNFALAFPGIGKALAVWGWKGGRRVVSLLVASATAQAVVRKSPLYDSLSQTIASFKDPSLEIMIDESFQELQFKIHGWVLVAADRDSNAIKQAVVLALQTAFSFDSRELGQPVHLGDLLATIQNVDGVEAAEIDQLYLSNKAASISDTLSCGFNQVLVINPDPDGISLETRMGS